MKIVRISLIVVLSILCIVVAAGMYISLALPANKKVLPVKIDKTEARIERGRYLAHHVAVCIDCHSTRDWSRFSGPVLENTLGKGGEVFDKAKGFPGSLSVPNITPFALSKWTDGEIVRAVTTGINKDGEAIFPLMAYDRFGKMDKEDIYSIVAYIRSLPALESHVAKRYLEFPLNVINNLLPEDADFQQMPDEKNTIKYGAYLVNAAGCVDCHSKNSNGNVVAGTEFGGGMEFNQPAGILRSPNITSHQSGIGNWSEEAFLQRFKVYADSGYRPQKIGKNELNTPMPWTMYAGMKDSDLKAIYAYLRSVKPIEQYIEVKTFKVKR